MFHNAIVILIIAGPLGLFAALVMVGCRVFQSDLARAGWIGLALVPTLLTKASELWLLFWLTASLCYLLWFLQAVRKRSQYQPSIQTLLAATFMAAIAGLIIGQIELRSRQEIVNLLMTSVAFATWASMAGVIADAKPQWKSWSRKKTVRTFSIVTLIGASIALVLAWQDQFASNLHSMGSWPPPAPNAALPFLFASRALLDVRWFAIWILVTAISYACSCIATRWNLNDEQSALKQPTNVKRWWRWWSCRFQEMLIAWVTIASVALFWILIRPSGLNLPDPDATNVHKNMIHIARTMEAELIDVSMLDAKLAIDRKRFNTKAFLPWREKIKEVSELHSMRIPITGKESDIDMVRAQRQRNLARTIAFAAECQFANDQIAEAVETIATGLLWSSECRRGGLVIDDVIGMACTGSFAYVVWNHREQLTQEQRNSLIGCIIDGLAAREGVTSIQQRDNAWIRSALGWFGRLQQIAAEYETDAQSFFATLSDARKRETATLRLTINELMLSSYHHEYKKYPDSLDQLVWPEQATALRDDFHQDPFQRGDPFVYRKLTSSYTLYSVGPDGEDQQGQNAMWDTNSTKPSDDIQLKTIYAEW
jgi:hypothetical protein